MQRVGYYRPLDYAMLVCTRQATIYYNTRRQVTTLIVSDNAHLTIGCTDTHMSDFGRPPFCTSSS